MSEKDDDGPTLLDWYHTIHQSSLKTATRYAFTKRLAYEYEYIETDFGNTFLDCIRPNVEDPNEMFPRIYDEQCIDTFEMFFKKVWEFSGKFKNQTYKDDWDELNLDFLKPNSEFTSMIITVDLEARRNFSGYPFGETKLTGNTKALAHALIAGIIGLKMHGEYLSTLDRARISMLEKNGLFFGDEERVTKKIKNSVENPALERGIYFGTENAPSVGTQVVAYVNMDDHLRIVTRDNDFQDLQQAYCTLKMSTKKILYNMNNPAETWDYVMKEVEKMPTKSLKKLFKQLDDIRLEELAEKALRLPQNDLKNDLSSLKDKTQNEPTDKPKEEQKKEIGANSETSARETSKKGSKRDLVINQNAMVPNEEPKDGQNKNQISKDSPKVNAKEGADQPLTSTEATLVSKKSADQLKSGSSDGDNIGSNEDSYEASYNFAQNKKYGSVCHHPSDMRGMCIRFLVRIPLLGSLPNVEDVLSEITSLQFVMLTKQCEDEDAMCYFISRQSWGMKWSKFIESSFNELLVILRLEKQMKACNPCVYEKEIMAVEPLDLLFNLIQKYDAPSFTNNHLSKLLLKKYSGVHTPFGGTFSHCIRANAYHPESVYPRACDPEAYEIFKEFFHPILKELNGITHLTHPKLEPNPFAEYNFEFSHPKIKEFRVRFARNVRGYGFPPTVSDVDRKLIEHKLKYCLSQLKGDLIGRYNTIEEIMGTPLEETNNYMDDDKDISLDAGIYRSWPKNRGVFDFFKTPDNMKAIAWVNGEDHLRVIVINKNANNPGLALKMCSRIIYHINRVLPDLFITDDNIGYLTFCPSEAGSGLRISALVSLKKLCKDMKKLKEVCQSTQLQLRGSGGEHTPIRNNVVDVSYKVRIGISEVEMMTNFIKGLKKLLAADE